MAAQQQQSAMISSGAPMYDMSQSMVAPSQQPTVLPPEGAVDPMMQQQVPVDDPATTYLQTVRLVYRIVRTF